MHNWAFVENLKTKKSSNFPQKKKNTKFFLYFHISPLGPPKNYLYQIDLIYNFWSRNFTVS